MTVDISSETMKAKRKWNNILEVLKGKVHQPRVLCPEKLSFRNKGEIKISSDVRQLRDFVASTPVLK